MIKLLHLRACVEFVYLLITIEECWSKSICTLHMV